MSNNEHQYAQSESQNNQIHLSPRIKFPYTTFDSLEHKFLSIPHLKSPTKFKTAISISICNPKIFIQNNNITGSQLSKSKFINNSYFTFKECNCCGDTYEDNKTETQILRNVLSDIAFSISNEQSLNFQKKFPTRKITSDNNIHLVNYESETEDNMCSYLEGLEEFKRFRKVLKPQVCILKIPGI
jgi:hypothetical protein